MLLVYEVVKLGLGGSQRDAPKSGMQELLEARAGVEPAPSDLQSDASPFCHLALLKVLLSFSPRSNSGGRPAAPG
jgi:hypothetical protein